MVTLCGNPRSTSWTACASRSGPATRRASPSARKPATATGTVVGMIGMIARSVATTWARRARASPVTGSAMRARSRCRRAAIRRAGGRRSDQRQRDERRHPVAQKDPQHGPGERPPPRAHRSGGASDGSSASNPRTTTAERDSMTSKTSGHEPASDRVPQRRREVDERPAARDAERGGPDHRVDGAAGGQTRPASRPTTRNAEQAHRRDRPGQALRQGGVEVDAQARPRARAAPGRGW